MSLYEEQVRRAVEAMRTPSPETYEGYGWIRVPRYKMDETKPWEDRYRELERHHIAETTFLIDKVRELARQLNSR